MAAPPPWKLISSDEQLEAKLAEPGLKGAAFRCCHAAATPAPAACQCGPPINRLGQVPAGKEAQSHLFGSLLWTNCRVDCHADHFQQPRRVRRGARVTAVVELYSWAGPCGTVIGTYKRLTEGVDESVLQILLVRLPALQLQ